MKENPEEEKPEEKVTAAQSAAHENPDGKLELFVKSLSFNVDEDWLRSHFEKHGELTKVKLIQKDGRSRGIAFVEYARPEDAAKALSENGVELDGRVITVEFSGDSKPAPGGPSSGQPGVATTIFCGNISFRSTEDSIWGFFE